MSAPIPVFVYIRELPAGLAPERRKGLVAFITQNFQPRISIVEAEASTEICVMAAATWADDDANIAALAALVALYLSADLVTIADAAAACNVPIKRISAAVGVGALRGYVNPAAPNPRKGGTLVSLAECRQKWGDDGTPAIRN